MRDKIGIISSNRLTALHLTSILCSNIGRRYVQEIYIHCTITALHKYTILMKTNYWLIIDPISNFSQQRIIIGHIAKMIQFRKYEANTKSVLIFFQQISLMNVCMNI